MPNPIPSCFRCGAVGAPPASTATGPSLTTSIYETHLGLVAFSWSRTVLGLSLRVDLHSAGGGAAAATEEEDEETIRFCIRPWMFWKRRGSKLFHLKDHRQNRTVEFTWDLTWARFPPGGGPEPSAGYFVAVVVDGEMLLVAGDLEDKAYRKTKAAKGKSPWDSILISRREHVALGESGGGRSYKTRARFGGKEREISIDLGTKEKERDVGMRLGVDGESVLQVRRLRWKFRGSEQVDVEGGTRIQVSWDLYNWFFQPKNKVPATASTTAAAAAELGHAVFLFRFEWEAGKERHFVKGFGGPAMGPYYKGIGGYLGKNRNRSESSSGDWGGNGEGRRRRRREEKKGLLKTTSSSPSSASSASSSTVMEWASPEETELQSADGFLLLVHAWKS